jgi:hypothetical protein
VVHVSRLKGGARKVLRVSEIVGLKQRRHYRVRDLFVFRQAGVHNGQAVGEFAATGRVPTCLERLHAAEVELPPESFAARVLPTAAARAQGAA